MDIRQNNNDFTVQPASRMMASNAVNAEIFSALANHDRLLYHIIEILEKLDKIEILEELDKRVSDLEKLAFDSCIPTEYTDSWGEDE